MNSLRRVGSLVALAMLVLAGSAVGSPNPQSFGYEEWEDAVKVRDVDPRDAVYPFRVTPEMVAWAEDKVRAYSTANPETRLDVLQRALFDANEFDFSYDEIRTLTAEDAFAVRSGNCMSFTAMFVALSRSLEIPTFLVSVRKQPGVQREGGLVVVNRHVVAGYRGPSKMHIFDFYVSTSAPYVTQMVIDDVMASAIYHTNLGGLAIREGDLDGALRHLELATALSPEWAPGWINLGVVHYRLGDVDGALRHYQQALSVEPGNSSALTNMAHVYGDLGREVEARTALKAAADKTKNPFTLISMADSEMVRGDLNGARKYLRRARWWYGREPEVYDALARLARLERDDNKAEKYSRRAAELRSRVAEAASAR